MKTAFDDYRDKMNNLANANDAEAFCLDELSKECRTVATECQNVADSLHKLSGNITEANDGLFGNVRGNSLTLQ